MTKFTKKSKLSLKKLNKKQNLSLNGSLRVSLGLNRSKNTQLTSRQRLDALVARHDRSDSTLVERITKAAIFVGLLFLGYRIWAVAGYPALPQIRVYALDEAEALLKALVENCARNYQHGTWTPEEAEELGRAILESLDWFDRTNVDHTPFDPEWFEMHHEAAKVLYQMLREGYVDSLKQIIAEKVQEYNAASTYEEQLLIKLSFTEVLYSGEFERSWFAEWGPFVLERALESRYELFKALLEEADCASWAE